MLFLRQTNGLHITLLYEFGGVERRLYKKGGRVCFDGGIDRVFCVIAFAGRNIVFLELILCLSSAQLRPAHNLTRKSSTARVYSHTKGERIVLGQIIIQYVMGHVFAV